MKKGLNIILIIASILSVFLFPITNYGAIILALACVIFAFFKANHETLKQVLCPTICLFCAALINGFFTLFLGIFTAFNNVGTPNYKFARFLSGTMSVVDGILYTLLFVVIVLVVVFFLLKKEVPLLSDFVGFILGDEKQQKTKKETEQPKEDNEEPEEIIIEEKEE